MPDIAELRCFLAGLSGGAERAERLPPQLFHIARSVLRRGDLDAVQDLVADMLLDLLERRGQAGDINHLLELENQDLLLSALRRRAVQLSATQHGGRWRLVKSLRSHITAALEAELPPAHGLPVSLVEGGRLSAEKISEAVAYLLAQPDAPERTARAISARLMDLYFAARATGADDGDRDHNQAASLDLLDAPRHAVALRSILDADEHAIVVGRARGLTLTEAGQGKIAASTAHDRLWNGVRKIRSYAQRTGMGREELEAAFTCCGA